jgi:PAS domain S-box-containing protein
MPGVGWFDVALGGAVASSVVVLAGTLREGDAPGARYLAAMLVGAIIWAGLSILQRQTTDLGVSTAVAVGIFVGIFVVVTSYPFFALTFGGYREAVSTRLYGLLWVFPAALLLVMTTNVDAGALWTFQRANSTNLAAVGPGFWLFVAYAYALNLVSTILLLRAAARSKRFYQSQVAAIVVAVLAPWISNVLFLFGPLDTDPTAIAFAVSGLALFYAMQQLGFLDVTPVARDTLVDTIDAGMIVLDDEDRVLDTNEAFRTAFDLSAPAGEDLATVLGPHSAVRDALRERSTESQVVATGDGSDTRYFELTGSSLAEGSDDPIGHLFLLHDVTDREERESRLRESEQRYRTLAENFPRGVVALFDDDRRYYLVEGGVFEYIDLEEADFEGRTIDDVHTEGYVERFGGYYDSVFEGERHTFEFYHDGRTYRTRLVPVRDASGAVTAGMSMSTDITELKDRERELERYETVVETVPDGVFLIDDEATLITANRGGAAMLGLEPGTVEGRTIESFIDLGIFDPAVPERYDEIVADLLSDETDAEEVTYTHEIYPVDGDTVLVEAHITLLPYDRDFQGLVAVYRDVTDREEVMRELERQNEQLEQFASVVSHDLRNPLNVANSRVELARETGDLDHLDGAVEAHQRMDSLIDDVLELARQGDLVTETEPVHLAAVAQEAWSHIEAPAASLEVETDGAVAADRSRLSQLLQNCLHNAVQHGGPEVTITVGLLDGEADGADGFYVADDGPGIDPGDRETVFEYGTTDHVDGTGLGLAIVKDIAEGHGWEVEVAESDAGGARIEFRGVAVPARP